MFDPKMTVHIAPVGNPLSDGSSSLTGHMWITLTDSFGNDTSFGLSPKIAGTPAGDGKIFNTDDDHYINPPYNYSKTISEEQYEKVFEWAQRAQRESDSGNGRWAEYNGVWNSCVDFSWEAMNQAGITDTPESGWQGNLFPWFNRWQVERRFRPDEVTHQTIASDVSDYFRNATTWRRRDPLAIDLDGDGIETLPVGTNPILFDHNADGIKTGTGWLKGDDAWLVFDRDANGTIDSGRELFGVDTLITNADGSTRNATSGFDALKSLDANNDGIFNSLDAAFTQVRLWQDLNSDGVSQSNELSTLAAKGIASISLTASTTTTDLGNGNTVTGKATVVRTNGTTTEADTVSVGADSAANLNLADNPFYREFTDTIPLTAAAQALPDMRGSGSVRDLREAMSLGTPQAARLTQAVQVFSSASTRDAQLAALDEVLLAWAETGPDLSSSLKSIPGQEVYVGRAEYYEDARIKFANLFGSTFDLKHPGWRDTLAAATFTQSDA